MSLASYRAINRRRADAVGENPRRALAVGTRSSGGNLSEFDVVHEQRLGLGKAEYACPSVADRLVLC